MLITSYNSSELGDTLITILRPDSANQTVTTHGDVTRIADAETDETLGYNFFNVSRLLGPITTQGQLLLKKDEVAKLNAALQAADFAGELVADLTPKFIVGYVESVEKHPKADHLLVTQTRVDHGKTLQIVSGSPNMQADILVVVAKVGAMMPDGLIIWPGELRGVESNGMIVAGRELRLPNAPQKKGALILPNDYQPVGAPFDFERAQQLFTK